MTGFPLTSCTKIRYSIGGSDRCYEFIDGSGCVRQSDRKISFSCPSHMKADIQVLEVYTGIRSDTAKLLIFGHLEVSKGRTS
jgi:hypothetical protein